MSKTRFISAAVAAVAASAVVAGWATVSPASALSAAAGYHQVVDETGTISMLVPDTYTVDISPVDWNGDGILDPRIMAAQGESLLVYVALPYNPSYQPWDGTCDPNGECPGLLRSDAYSDAEFTGFRQLIDGCCDSGLYETVDANANNGLFLAHVEFSYGSTQDAAELGAYETALSSFTSTGSPLPGTSVETTDGDAVFPYVDFYDVPQLGREPVRGSGCGGNGEIGDVIPDGIWAGFAGISGATVQIDLLCVYTPQAATGVVTSGTANIINNDPNWLVVNNNERLRYSGVAPSVALRDGIVTADGGCVEGPPTGDHTTISDRQAWVNIEGGVVTWILWGCAPFGAAPNPSQTPSGANLPPAYPDYSDGVGHVWPYGPFWNVPTLGSEPVRGSGCGAEGQIGPTIPDGLWAGFVDGYDASQNGYWVDLLCIFMGPTAQAVIADGTANILVNQPDYLVVNNNTQTRFVPNGLAAFIAGDNSSGECLEGTHISPEQNDLVPQNRQRQAWIRIAGGVATWIFYSC